MSASVASTTPNNVIPIHTAVPGRVRIRVAPLRHNARLKHEIEETLRRLQGVDHARACTWTGNVLVTCDPAITLHTIEAAIERALHDKAGPMPAPMDADFNDNSVQPQETAWHHLATTAVAERLESSEEKGLSRVDARDRLARMGPNALPRQQQRSKFAILVEQFESLPIALLGASAVVSLMTGGVFDAIAIAGVLAINATIGYVTETQSEQTIASLSAPTATSVAVLRDGAVTKIPMDDVVVGDVQVLEPGVFVAADARILSADNLTVDESMLTGESMPVQKAPDSLSEEDVPLGDRSNMIYRGTVLTGGSGRAMVVATGMDTEIGRIQAMVGTSTTPDTPMQLQLDRMGRQLALLSGGVCVLVFALGLLRGQGVVQMLNTATSLAVAAVPEGLPAMATTTLALGIRKMRRQGVLIRHLDAIETLGAVQVVCFDKTGTLTLNRMQVRAIHCGGRGYRLVDGTLKTEDASVDPGAREDVHRLAEAAVLCNETEIIGNGNGGEEQLRGSPTEAALVRLAIDLGVDATELRRRRPNLSTNHRTEKRSFMATLHGGEDDQRLLAVKGSPETVLAMSRWYLKDGERVPLTDDIRQTVDVANQRMGGEALRVLGIAYADTGAQGSGAQLHDAAANEAPSNGTMLEDHPLTWLGLVGMADPTRPRMQELMHSFHEAGIRTVMVTGDQSATAYAIAKELQLAREESLQILDSASLKDLEPDVLTGLARRAHVFARVSPSHKLQIVQALQQGGAIIAMTGDGINDSPALKAANIGLAMGAAGTDVARDVADVILKDDNPETIIVAIRHGRTLYGNVRKSLRFLLATNLSEILLMVGATAAGLRQTLTPMQLLWINLMTDVFPALALAIEPPESDVMKEKPRDGGEAIMRAGDLKRVAFEGVAISGTALATCVYGNVRYGPGARTGTMTFLSLITAQMLHALTCRTDHYGLFKPGRPAPNRYLQLAVGGSFFIQVLALLTPQLRRLLGLSPISAADAAITATAALLPYVVNEAAKPSSDRLSPAPTRS
jgi:P-type Ca2+ transporter type 2C